MLIVINNFAQLWLVVTIIGSMYIHFDSRAAMSDPYAYQMFPLTPGYKRWLFWRYVTLAVILTAFILWIVSLFV
jgi:hypothetical protein